MGNQSTPDDIFAEIRSLVQEPHFEGSQSFWYLVGEYCNFFGEAMFFDRVQPYLRGVAPKIWTLPRSAPSLVHRDLRRIPWARLIYHADSRKDFTQGPGVPIHHLIMDVGSLAYHGRSIGSLGDMEDLLELEVFEIRGGHLFSNDDLEGFINHPAREHLEVLDIYEGDLTDKALHLLTRCPHLRNLKVLHLIGCRRVWDGPLGITDVSPLYHPSSTLKSLEFVSLSNKRGEVKGVGEAAFTLDLSDATNLF